MSTTKETYAFTVFERLFQEQGLPRAIRTDNGVPFASAGALFGLSKLSVWWLRLGIQLEREIDESLILFAKSAIPSENAQ